MTDEQRRRFHAKRSGPGGTRTRKPCGTGSEDLRVCQFHHRAEGTANDSTQSMASANERQGAKPCLRPISPISHISPMEII